MMNSENPLDRITVDFWDKISEEIKRHGNNSNNNINQIHHELIKSPVLLCVAAQVLMPPPTANNNKVKYVFDLVDSTYKYKGHCVMAQDQSRIYPHYDQIEQIRGKLVCLLRYRTLSSKQKHIVVCDQMEVNPNDYTCIVETIYRNLIGHPGLIVRNDVVESHSTHASSSLPIKVSIADKNPMNSIKSTNDQSEWNSAARNVPDNTPVVGKSEIFGQDFSGLYNKVSSPSFHSRNENESGISVGSSEKTSSRINDSNSLNYNKQNFNNPYSQILRNSGSTSNGNNNFDPNESETNYRPQRPQPSKIAQQASSSSAPYSSSGPIGRRSDGMYLKINDLSQYTSKWTIKARVTCKSEIKKFTNARGEGQLFSVDLCDKNGEIRATFFGRAVDKFYDEIVENSVYLFSKGMIKPSNKRYNYLKHSCEIAFDESAVVKSLEEDLDIPKVNYDFIPISKILEKDVGSIVDTIAVVFNFKEMQPVILRSTGQPKDKRELILIDDSGSNITLSLWGEKTLLLDDKILSQKPIVAFKGLKVSEWQGVKLDSTTSTKVDVSPDNEKAMLLRMWWEKKGKDISQSIMNSNLSSSKDVSYKTIECIMNEVMAAPAETLTEKGIYFSCQCAVERIHSERFSWPACPDCKKKMQANADPVTDVSSSWTCHNCNKTVDKPNHTYLLNLTLIDHTGTLKCTAMGERAEELMGNLKAEELYTLQEQQTVDNLGRSFDDIFLDLALTEWIMRIRAQSETYMDETKTKYRVYSAVPLRNRLTEEIRTRMNYIKDKMEMI